jgi:hypothetical protein
VTTLTTEQLIATGKKLIQYHSEADEKNEWTFFVDEMYHPDCVYSGEYGGNMEVVADGIVQIKATHTGRDTLRGWERRL